MRTPPANVSLAVIMFAALILGGGCAADRQFSTASPDVEVDKSQQQLTGDFLTINVPESMTITLEGDVPERVGGDLTVAIFGQRHSANSETGLDSTLENATELSDLFRLDPDTQVNTGGGAGSQE